QPAANTQAVSPLSIKLYCYWKLQILTLSIRRMLQSHSQYRTTSDPSFERRDRLWVSDNPLHVSGFAIFTSVFRGNDFCVSLPLWNGQDHRFVLAHDHRNQPIHPTFSCRSALYDFGSARSLQDAEKWARFATNGHRRRREERRKSCPAAEQIVQCSNQACNSA